MALDIYLNVIYILLPDILQALTYLRLNVRITRHGVKCDGTLRVGFNFRKKKPYTPSSSCPTTAVQRFVSAHAKSSMYQYQGILRLDSVLITYFWNGNQHGVCFTKGYMGAFH